MQNKKAIGWGTPAAALAAASFLLAPLSYAQTTESWPVKPITMIVPFAAGGSTDIVARRLSQSLSNKIGKPVIVENKPGAGGTIGANYARSSPPDGYTLFLGTVSTQSVAPFLYKSLPFDPATDFTPLNLIATVPNVVVVNKSANINNLADFVSWARSKPNGLTYGSSGLGSSNHLATEGLRARLNIPLTHVPYRGSGPALADTLAGHVDFMLDVVMTSAPHIERGDLKAIAVTSSQRVPLLPNVPTVAEQGYPGFEAIGWFGLLGPKSMPPELAKQISETVREIIASASMSNFLVSQGAVPSQATLGDFEKIIDQDRKHWGEIAKEAGIQPE